MIDWRIQKTIDYLNNLNVGLPDSDWDDFLSRKSAHDLAIKRHRRFLLTTLTIPAAAVFMLLFLIPMDNDIDKKNIQENSHTYPEQLDNNRLFYQEHTPVKSTGSSSNPDYKHNYPTKEWEIKSSIEKDSTSYIMDNTRIDKEFE
ncbi:MAG: hypothetical protein J5705_08080 [Bacteroidaceae bacterium]|nr:hypothetical protein [Bacteroidaceae bacterium]